MSVKFTCPACGQSWEVTVYDMSKRGMSYEEYIKKPKPVTVFECICGQVVDTKKSEKGGE